MRYILSVDIGGTTFNTGLFSESLNLISISKKDKIRYYNDKDEVIHAITNQIKTIISDNNIKNSEIIGLGIVSPGPLDSKKA